MFELVNYLNEILSTLTSLFQVAARIVHLINENKNWSFVIFEINFLQITLVPERENWLNIWWFHHDTLKNANICALS